MICNTILRVIICPDFLTTVHGRHLRLSLRFLLIHSLFIFHLKQSLLQYLCCSSFVRILAPFLLDKNCKSSWNVGGPTGWLYLVDTLSSRSTWFGELIFDILEIQLKIERDYRHNNKRNCARMKPSLSFSLRDSDDLMDSCLTFHHFMTTLSLDSQIELFVALTNPTFLDWVRYWTSPAHHGGKRLIHLTDILHKDTAFRPPSSRLKLQDNIISLFIKRLRYKEFQTFLS